MTRAVQLAAISSAIVLAVTASGSPAQGPRPGPTRTAPLVEEAIADSWPEQRPEWRARLAQDDTMRLCSFYRNKPPRRVAAVIHRIARGSIVYPPDGTLIGDWRAGEAIAQSGYGLRFTDNDPNRANGGNCYACHRLTRAEQSYGTLGPDLLGYGRLKDFSPETARRVYEQIYNANSHVPCSGMPRFGAGKVLTVTQIKDLVALLMARDSPVNR